MKKKVLSLALALLFLLATSPLQAGLVTRPTKTCGQTTYVAEVAAGCTTIKSSEVDADLNAIITGGVNNIETANLADLAVTTAKIADGAVTAIKLSGAAATISNFASANINTSLSFTTVETTILTLPSITTVGGRIFIGGDSGLNWTCAAESDGALITLTLRVKRDGSTIHTLVHPSIGVSQTGTMDFGMPIALPIFSEVPTAAAHVYTITAQTSVPSPASTGCFMITNSSDAGVGYVVEYR